VRAHRIVSVVLTLCVLLAVPLGAQRLGPEQKRPKLADADTNDAAAYLAHGMRAIEDAPDEAAAAFYWAARLDPSSAEALYGRRVALLMRRPSDLNAYMNNNRRARENTRFRSIDSLQLRALRLDPLFYRRLDKEMIFAYYRYVFKEAAGSMQRGELDMLLRNMILQEPPYARAEYMYGVGRLDQALIEYEDAIKAARNPLGLRMDRARVYALQGANQKAIDEFTAVGELLRTRDEKKGGFVVLYESKALVEHSIGVLHVRHGNPDEAKAAFGRAMTEDLSYFPAHLELGRLSLELHDTTTAVSELALAADLAPDEPYVHYLHGSVLLAAGQADEAVAPLRRAVELEDLYAAPRFALGQALERMGDGAGALAEYQRFLELAARRDPQRGDATQRIAALQGGR
jgi:tetratricopeptide (TPR) repeat protein